ncbi:hypothetical protein [Candidatus Enterococcus ferrettii]|nr:hypothetical protein [Enterococcus sp. 665A]MBO1341922.1 hypothetical protein [Enterococcus sp. 665A]
MTFMLAMGLPAEAATSAETKIKITITQTSPPVIDGGGDVIQKNPSDHSSIATSGKRLPVTGESYSQLLSCLGYLTLGVTVLLFVLGKERKDQTYEASN